MALVPPAARRPLSRARRRPGLDGALGANRPAGLRAAGRRSRPHPRGVRRRGPCRRRRPRLGRADRARLGARAPGAGARDPARQHGRRDAARRRAAADPLRTPRAAARPRLPADVGLSADDARDRARAHRQGGEERVSRAVRVERRPAGDRGLRRRHSRRRLPTRRMRRWRRVADRLAELKVPVLLAWGERDPVFHLAFAADLRGALAAGRAAPIPARRASRRRGGGRRGARRHLDRAAARADPRLRPGRRAESGQRSWPRSWRARPTRRRRSPSVAASRSRSPRSPTVSPRSPRACGMPASRPATASRCSRPIHPTSSRPPTPAGRSAPSPSSSTAASGSRDCGARCGAPSRGGWSARARPSAPPGPCAGRPTPGRSSSRA